MANFPLPLSQCSSKKIPLSWSPKCRRNRSILRLQGNCDRPYPTGIIAVTDDGRFVTDVVTDEQGRFEVFLKPGD